MRGGTFDDEIDAAKQVNQLCEENGMSPKNPDVTGEPSHGLKRNKRRSQFFGVSWNKGADKWIAQIFKNGKQIHGGYFDDEIDAAKRVNQLCEKFRISPRNPDISGKPFYGSTKKIHSSKYAGVHLNKQKTKWIASITKDGKTNYGGRFFYEVNAAKRVNQLCKELRIPEKNPEISEKTNNDFDENIPKDEHFVNRNKSDGHKHQNKRKRSEDNFTDFDDDNYISFLKKSIFSQIKKLY